MHTMLAVLAGLLIIPAFILASCICEEVEERMGWKDGVLMNVLSLTLAPVIAIVIVMTVFNWWKS